MVKMLEVRSGAHWLKQIVVGPCVNPTL